MTMAINVWFVNQKRGGAVPGTSTKVLRGEIGSTCVRIIKKCPEWYQRYRTKNINANDNEMALIVIN